ncbi:3-isopropylmalate dehydrogenase [candidate division KSB1 bacterium]|nr:3-isopropylmalate dehydrogenase [candidate division KSB1 bacterium]
MRNNKKVITVLPGDGIGTEVVTEACKILELVARHKKFSITLNSSLIGGAAFDAWSVPLTDETLKMCFESDAILLGAVGGPRWEKLPHHLKPEQALLRLRRELGLFANVRPAKIYRPLIDVSTLKPAVIEQIDLVVLRELTGGLYFGEPRGIRQQGHEKVGVNTMTYTTTEIERIARAAFEMAVNRRQKVTSVDKANVLETSQLWREVVSAVAHDYPEISLNHLYVDNCAMQLVRNPQQFDVILTENMFGDILSDEAAMLTGSIGMLPSASLGKFTALYEPVHGSAPDIAGQGIANPIATIASVAMMFQYSFNMPAEARAIEQAIELVLEQGYRTADLAQNGKAPVSTQAMGDLVAAAVTEFLN